MCEFEFTVITPHYGSDRYLHECCDSVDRQTYPNISHLVVFDGGQISNPVHGNRRSVCLFDNRGPAVARNFGATIADGDWIVFLDSDDVLSPDYIERCADFIKGNSDIDIFRGVGRNFDGKNYGKRSSNFFFDISKAMHAAANIVGGPTGLVVRRAFFEENQFESKMLFFEDWEYYLRVVLAGNKIAICQHATFGYRISNLQLTTVNKEKKHIVERDARYFIDKYRYRLKIRDKLVLQSALIFRSKKIFGDSRYKFYMVLHVLIYPMVILLEFLRRLDFNVRS